MKLSAEDDAFRALPIDPENKITRLFREGVIDAVSHGKWDEVALAKLAGHVLGAVEALETKIREIEKGAAK